MVDVKPFTIVTTMARPGELIYYEDGFRTVVETCLNQLKNIDVIREDILLEHVQQYQGNFYGYLVDKGIRPEWHWIYLRVNGYTHAREFGSELRDPLNPFFQPVLIRPNEALIQEIRNYYLNQKR